MPERTAHRWLARHRAGGERALHDRSSSPARSPHRLPAEVTAAIDRLRRPGWSGPRIARALGRPVSTAGAVLRRLGLGRLRAREAQPLARGAAGDPLHIDNKKLAWFADLGVRIERVMTDNAFAHTHCRRSRRRLPASARVT